MNSWGRNKSESIGTDSFGIMNDDTFEFYLSYKGTEELLNDYFSKKVEDPSEKKIKKTISHKASVNSAFISSQRIEEIKLISKNKYDFSKLIRLCEELNIAARAGSQRSLTRVSIAPRKSRLSSVPYSN